MSPPREADRVGHADSRERVGCALNAHHEIQQGAAMALLDRVATLVRANLNDLVDRAENPEKMLKQFMQVKTQVAIALADLHLLQKKKKENLELHAEWMRKAELAVAKSDDKLARAALERSMSFQQL